MGRLPALLARLLMGVLNGLLSAMVLAGTAGMAGSEAPAVGEPGVGTPAAGGAEAGASEVWGAEAEVTGEAAGLKVPLQCQLGKGPWQNCRMDIETLGEHWWLQVGSERIEFRHDGRGNVRMRQGLQAWRSVRSSWSSEAALCWNGVCAKGAIPLD